MKRSLILLIATFCVVFLGAVAPLKETPMRILSHSNSQIRISLDSANLELVKQIGDTQNFTDLRIDGFNIDTEENQPRIPYYSTIIAIPPRGGYTVSYTENGVKNHQDVIPSLQNDSDGNSNTLSPERGVYFANPVVLGEAAIMRDFRILQITMYPFSWDAHSKTLKQISNLEVTVSFNDRPSTNELSSYQSYSPAFEKIYASTIANFEFYRENMRSNVNPKIQIIHGNSTDTVFLNKMNEFVNWKRQKGFDVSVASTSVAGSSNTAIKTYLSGLYANPATRPDFIILVGDTNGSFPVPTFYESQSSYNGEGDYPYTHLAGTDLLGDVFIGRLSAENTSQFDVLINKIFYYEKNVNNTQPAAGWYDRILLIGDPSSSGISTIYTNKFIKERAKQVNPNYSFIENYSGGYSSTMNQGINQGVGFFNYRGYIGMSGWSPSSSLINGNKLPHAVIITCSTGSFANSTSTTEALFRLGTSAVPSGSITAIGMATSGTHTGFNNSLTSGIFDGIFTHGMRTMGEALLNGKMNIHNVYNATNPSQAMYFAHWCNLMGDPSVEVFVGVPRTLVLSAPANIPAGTHLVDVSVNTEEASPIANVSVTIYSQGSNTVVARGFTDDNGNISLPLPESLSGNLIFTASMPDAKPVQFQSMIDPAGALVFETTTISGDGEANPGETLEMFVSLKNTRAETLSGIQGTLSTNDPYINILQNVATFPTIAAGGIQLSNTAFSFSVSSNPPPNHDVRFELQLSDSSGGIYQAPFHVMIVSAKLNISSFMINAGGNSILDPAENGFVTIAVQNVSSYPVHDVYAELSTLDDLVSVIDSLAYYGSIAGGSIVNPTENYMVFARPLLIPGMQIPMRLRLFNDTGFEQTLHFNINIGSPSISTPLGPDSYGYFIYDWMDTSYPDCPVYDWQDIHPGFGGAGTLLALNDSGSTSNEGDQVGSTALAVVDLPFNFPFYGIDYNQITVCVNGFIAMGITENGDFRNYRLPGPLGAAPMIAAFWDDLVLIGDAGIYKYYNANDNTFIIQYHKLRNGYNRTSEETFQVIFYDPQYYPTGLGDGQIKIQYKVINNVDIGAGGYTPYHGNYASIGIKDHTNTRGLEYSYNNQYPTSAAVLSNEKAILITTRPVLHQSPHIVISETIVNESNGNGVVEPGDTVELGIKLSNLGLDTAYSVNLSTFIVNNYVTVINDSSSYANIPGSAYAVNNNPIKFVVSEDCPANHVINIPCLIEINGNNWQYNVTVIVRKPQLSIGAVYINDFLSNANGMVEPGETFKLIVNYMNTGNVEARNVTSNIFCSDNRINIQNPEMLLNDIPLGTTMQAVYQVSVSQDMPMGTYITFYLTYLGDLISAQNDQIVVSCGTTGMNADFEMNNGNFVATPASTGWEWGTSTYSGAHSGTKVWGTRLNSEYPASASYSLVSPSVYIGPNFALEFYHRYDMESTYDGGNLKVSTNGGSTWTLIHPEGGYPQSNVIAMNEPGYSGSLLNWSLARFYLNALSGQNVLFKWTMMADTMIQGQGWFIDDVSTTGHIDFASMISGTIQTGNPDYVPSSILIKASNGMAVHPNTASNYELFLPQGNFSLEVSGGGYQTQNTTPFVTGVNNPIITRDFYLGYLNPVSNQSFIIQDNVLSITWQAPEEPEFELMGYRIYKKLNADRFEQIGQVNEELYTEALAVYGSYKYYVTALYAEGESMPSLITEFMYPYVQGDEPPAIALENRLYHNYPNPFNPSTTIAFSTKVAGSVKLNVYNLKGQLVRSLVNDIRPAGSYKIVWDGKDTRGKAVAGGIYLYRIESPGFNQTRKAIMMK